MVSGISGPHCHAKEGREFCIKACFTILYCNDGNRKIANSSFFVLSNSRTVEYIFILEQKCRYVVLWYYSDVIQCKREILLIYLVSTYRSFIYLHFVEATLL